MRYSQAYCTDTQERAQTNIKALEEALTRADMLNVTVPKYIVTFGDVLQKCKDTLDELKRTGRSHIPPVITYAAYESATIAPYLFNVIHALEDVRIYRGES